MSLLVEPDFNQFLSGHLVVDNNRNIIFCNDYICQLSDISSASILTSSLSHYITKASLIFMDSYIYPLLMNEAVAQQIQITWQNTKGKRIPVIVNISLGENDLTYWSLYVCENRDKLQSELLKANKQLEKQSQELFALATTDPLTGLLNRRELTVKAEEAIHQASRSQSTLALLTIDIDHFKRINDNYGHQIGDNVLVGLANILTEYRRKNDLVARVGGEEFILVLANIDQESAFLLTESLRKKIAQTVLNEINITVSIGLVYTSKNQDVNYQKLLQLSDNALYESKRLGRNTTTSTQYFT